MTGVNWGLAGNAQRGFQNALAFGMQMGAQARQAQERREYKNALAQFDPSNPETLKPIMQANPEVGIRLQGQVEARQQAAAQKQSEQMIQMRKLLEFAGENPQQAFAAARQMGIDTSQIPQPGSPEFEPWRQQQLFIMGALEKEGDNLPGLAREVMMALPEDQRDPNSPVFRQAFTAALENKYAAEYTDEQGNTRRRAIIAQPQQVAPQQQGGIPGVTGETMSFEQYQGMVQQLSPEAAARQAKRLSDAGVRFTVSTPDQASQLPPGTRYTTPDGAEYIR